MLLTAIRRFSRDLCSGSDAEGQGSLEPEMGRPKTPVTTFPHKVLLPVERFMFKCEHVLMVSLLAIGGCTQPADPAHQPDPGVSATFTRSAADEWEQFIRSAKGRIGDAEKAFARTGTGLEVKFVADDVRRSNSLKYLAEGIVELRVKEVFMGFERNKNLTVTFGFADEGSWEWLSCEEVVTDSGNRHEREIVGRVGPLTYEPSLRYLRALFNTTVPLP